jgi:sensor histidine kinase YesM
MTITSNISFFPKESKFWLYHLGMLSVLAVLQVLINSSLSTGGELFWFHVIDFTIWLTAYTIAVLYYRICYKKRQWQDKSTVMLIFISMILSVVFAHLMFGINSAITLPIYWDEFYAQKIIESPNLTESQLLIRLYIANIISSSIFILAWVFLYMGITNARTAKLSQLDNLRLQNSLKEAQLSTLSNQLNPHFLFNSLNNIRFMIHENAEQADNMITALSEVLRYSLESSEHEKRLLSKEIEVILRYIEIVNIQFEDRLNFTMDVPEDLMGLTVPPMLLQMLIENAVKHGLEQLQHGGYITLSATKNSNYVEFRVINDIPEKDDYESNSTGLGLKNIQQRLELLYSDKASIETKRIDNEFEAKIRLPH